MLNQYKYSEVSRSNNGITISLARGNLQINANTNAYISVAV